MGNDRLTRRRFLAVAGATAGLAGCNAPTSGRAAEDGADTTELEELVDSRPEATSVYSEVYREAIDSVVMVRIQATNDQAQQAGQGSGFLFRGTHVITNEHVVQNASEVQVRFSDGSWRTGNVVGTDVYSDLAVIELPTVPEDTDSLQLVDGEVAVGQRVLAIGNPFGFTGSVSAGIVSGVDRTLPAANNFSIPDAIQTDAAVNPGNSGGPLMTLDGRVAGVINSGGGDNIGFAISAPLMRRVVPALIESGEYEHSYMGVRLTDVTPLIAEANDLSNATGVYIDEVVDGGPADDVLQGSTGRTSVDDVEVPTGGDVVVRMGGKPIHSRQALSTYLALATSPGETIPAQVVRDGTRTTVELTLGSRPEP